MTPLEILTYTAEKPSRWGGFSVSGRYPQAGCGFTLIFVDNLLRNR
jgi:hypothetical protein